MRGRLDTVHVIIPISQRDRIAEIVRLKCGGDSKDFAKLTGWAYGTVRSVLRNGTNSVALLTDILRAAPEISARWLLLGEGDMMRPFGLAYAEGEFLRRLAHTAETAALVPLMDAAQVRRFQVAVAKGAFPDFTDEEIAEIKARAKR